MHESELMTNASCESNTSLACKENYEAYGRGRWFLEESSTTGIACLDADKLTLARSASSGESRKATIPACLHPTVIALDGPLIPNASAQFMDLLSDSTAAPDEAYASYATPVIEAFPNAFLLVLLPQEDFRSAPKLRRGRRFDWLYDRVATNSSVRSALSKSLDLPGDVWHSFYTQCDHELRAALVVTNGFATVAFPFYVSAIGVRPGVVCGVAHAGRRSRAKIDGRTMLRNRVQPDGAGTAAGTRRFRVERKVGGSDGGVIARIREVRL